MASMVLKAIVGLVIATIIILILWYVWSSVFTLLPYSTIVDTQSYNSFNFIVNDINKIKLNELKESPYKLKSGYLLKYLNPKDIDIKLKEKYTICNSNSCVCLCQDTKCDKVECAVVNKKFKNSGSILGGKGGTLNIRYTNEGISIEPK